MDLVLHPVVLFVVAILGGIVNAVAGGGTFVTFPALVFAGMPAINANATSNVALWPGSLSSAVAFRREIRADRLTVILAIASFLGGGAGALALLQTPDRTFRILVPWLLLVATALFIANGPITRWLRARGHLSDTLTPRGLALMFVGQLAVAFYGGFFRGGIGIMLLAALSLMGLTNIHAMNGLKNLLITCVATVSVVILALAGVVYWPEALVMTVGAVIGGYLGGATTRNLSPKLIRGVIGAVGVALTVYFFVTA